MEVRVLPIPDVALGISQAPSAHERDIVQCCNMSVHDDSPAHLNVSLTLKYRDFLFFPHYTMRKKRGLRKAAYIEEQLQFLTKRKEISFDFATITVD